MDDNQQLTHLARVGLGLKNTPTLIVTAICALLFTQASIAQSTQRPLKVVIISMFPPEAAPWIAPLQLVEEIKVPGLPVESPAIKCNTDDVCVMIAGMGHANVAEKWLS